MLKSSSTHSHEEWDSTKHVVPENIEEYGEKNVSMVHEGRKGPSVLKTEGTQKKQHQPWVEESEEKQYAYKPCMQSPKELSSPPCTFPHSQMKKSCNLPKAWILTLKCLYKTSQSVLLTVRKDAPIFKENSAIGKTNLSDPAGEAFRAIQCTIVFVF